MKCLSKILGGQKNVHTSLPFVNLNLTQTLGLAGNVALSYCFASLGISLLGKCSYMPLGPGVPKEIQSLAQIQSSINCFYATFSCGDSCCYSGVWKSPVGLEYLYIEGTPSVGDCTQLTLRSRANSTNYSLDTCVYLPPVPCLICPETTLLPPPKTKSFLPLFQNTRLIVIHFNLLP